MIVAVVLRKQLPSLPDLASGTPVPEVKAAAREMAVPGLTTNQTGYQKRSSNLRKQPATFSRAAAEKN
jgi:hypothetical protein